MLYYKTAYTRNGDIYFTCIYCLNTIALEENDTTENS